MSQEKFNKPVAFDHGNYTKGKFRRRHHSGDGQHHHKHERHKHKEERMMRFKNLYEFSESQTKRADSYLTHPIWGLISFIFIIWFIFYSTFSLGAYPQAGIEWLMDKGAVLIRDNMTQGWLSDFLSQGVIMGVGSVLAFIS